MEVYTIYLEVEIHHNYPMVESVSIYCFVFEEVQHLLHHRGDADGIFDIIMAIIMVIIKG